MLKFYALMVMSLFFTTVVYAQDGEVPLLDKETVSTEQDKNKTTEITENKDVLFEFMGIKIPNFISSSSSSSSNPDKDNSISAVSRRAENGDIAAQLQLGYIYLYGQEGLNPDYEKAFYYYDLAAKQNDMIGLNNLATLYYNGVGVKRSPHKAAALFAQAAKLGNADAATNLGFMYISGFGIARDSVKGQEYLEQAADKGNVLAGFMTGYAYYKGINRSINYHKAAPLIKKAADDGLDEAQLVIADIYMKGLGYPRNYNAAVNYLLKAYSQGSIAAMMLLGDIYSGKTKYPADPLGAYVMYSLASVRGIAQAAEKLQILESQLDIEKVSQAQEQTANYVEKPSKLTTYVKQTYGNNLRRFLNKTI